MSQNLRTQLGALWDSHDLCDHFGVTPMTIYLWRKNRGLPSISIPGTGRPAVRFNPQEVIAWAAQQGIKPSRLATMRLAAAS